MRVRRFSISSSTRRAKAGDLRKLAPVLALTLFAVSGCASFNGMQHPITADDLDKDKIVCPTAQQLKDYSDPALTGVQKRDFRDGVVTQCVIAINAKYIEFKTALRTDAITSNLATDVLGLGLTGAAAVTKHATSKQFTQGALAVVGIGADIDKDVFFNQTLPAIEASMDANRDTLLSNIVNAEKNDPTGANYTLAQAALDLIGYQDAGDIDIAIASLTKTASDAAAKAATALNAAQTKPYTAILLPPDIYAREKAVTDKVWAMVDPADQPKLTRFATALGLTPPAGESFQNLQGDVVVAIDSAVSAPGANAAQIMSSVESAYQVSTQ